MASLHAFGAADASESAGYLVEAALGRYSPGLLAEWSPPDGFDEARATSLMPEHPNVCTDGGLVLDQVAGVSSSGVSLLIWLGIFGTVVGVVMLIKSVLTGVFSLVGFSALFLGLFSLFREPRWGVILALQSFDTVHLGIDNLGVVRHVGRLSWF